MSDERTAQIRERITIEPAPRTVTATFEGATLARSGKALLLKERGHDPVFYLPKEDVEMALMTPTDRHTTCPWKGEARYWSIRDGEKTADNAVWAYDTPHDGVGEIAGHVAFDRRFVEVAETD
ncbi:DUF427 domain-containing protein [Aurantimonas sp. VKM B-3413]|uniref:DUF427 domain-containing protein n=1 Tax=Aurantimonas sp. VKM B-3413 TaxID=2779401 RepID=UPI001E63CC16|nr:DUF427 domain-containing protein [Aurantimonas sp. VKM B-3413]MCB8840794.1 DUF427 domain-containing protein [Aurantimonas sp. VKM B-3413]